MYRVRVKLELMKCFTFIRMKEMPCVLIKKKEMPCVKRNPLDYKKQPRMVKKKKKKVIVPQTSAQLWAKLCTSLWHQNFS